MCHDKIYTLEFFCRIQFEMIIQTKAVWPGGGWQDVAEMLS